MIYEIKDEQYCKYLRQSLIHIKFGASLQKKIFPLALQWNFYLAFFINFLQFSDFPKEPFGTSSLLQLQFPTLKYKNHENKLHAVGAGTFTAGLSLHSALGCDIGQHTSQGNSFYFLWY